MGWARLRLPSRFRGRKLQELSGLGLRHVGYGVPTELFSPYVTAAVEAAWNRCIHFETGRSSCWGTIPPHMVVVLLVFREHQEEKAHPQK